MQLVQELYSKSMIFFFMFYYPNTLDSHAVIVFPHTSKSCYINIRNAVYALYLNAKVVFSI